MNDSIVTPKRILIATDLSARCDRALDRAVGLARTWHAELAVLHVIESAEMIRGWYAARHLPEWHKPLDPLRVARQRLHEALGDDASDLDITILVQEGDPTETILQVAQSFRADLIVLGVARDEPLGRVFVGDTVQRLMRRSSLPVLIVKARPRGTYRNIVVGTNLSEASRTALRLAADWFDAPLTLFNAYDVPFAGLSDDARRLREAYRTQADADTAHFVAASALNDRRIGVMTEYGPPSELIPAFAEARNVDLVVIGAQSRGFVLDLLIGGTGEALVTDLTCDTLVVPATTE
ncbi:universal stress protein [Kaistia dalseonensis]|uniref:Nucleotide-binding universal stress UspA family protein n=1 Tax=Kaistia dalseonensis TaxID=410840 RepID=A0ABU0H283_9HYPH|nr:universal stress protein [Kaistia dalseonensis]MCX5493849.1 universal stress protein [Kaistia dalseonensis]MDQ0436414.1 nucleotide-binding universal stress UspA family protein [Kaistia dalseonensis]